MTEPNPLPERYIIYYVNSRDIFFRDVSFPVLPNAYHLMLFSYEAVSKEICIMGTKYASRIYKMHESTLTSKVDDIFTYVIYNN